MIWLAKYQDVYIFEFKINMLNLTKFEIKNW